MSEIDNLAMFLETEFLRVEKTAVKIDVVCLSCLGTNGYRPAIIYDLPVYHAIYSCFRE